MLFFLLSKCKNDIMNRNKNKNWSVRFEISQLLIVEHIHNNECLSIDELLVVCYLLANKHVKYEYGVSVKYET